MDNDLKKRIFDVTMAYDPFCMEPEELRRDIDRATPEELINGLLAMLEDIQENYYKN